MQTVPAGFLDALTGSISPKVQVDAWYDGQLVAADLPLTAGSVTIDTTRTIAGSCSATFGSEDSTLAPTSWDSPLACYGSQLHVTAGLQLPDGLQMLSLGWFRIDSYDAGEWWKQYPGGQWVMVGTKVDNQCSDLMSALDDARFLAPTAPASLTSALTEIRRLAAGLVQIESLSGITDVAIPQSITYTDSRVQAITDLAALLGCVPRMSPDGALNLYPSAPAASVWTVSVDDGAPILGWGRRGDRVSLYNGVTSSGTASNGTQVQGSATQTTGPLRWGGPFGQVPYAHANPLLDSNSSASQDATSMLAALSSQQVVQVPVTLPWNPALEVGDVITLQLPDVALTGPVLSLVWPLTPGPMTAVVAIARTDLWGLG